MLVQEIIVLIILIIASVSDVRMMEVNPILLISGTAFCLGISLVKDGFEMFLYKGAWAAAMFLLVVLLNIVMCFFKKGGGLGGADALSLSLTASVGADKALLVFEAALVLCIVYHLCRKEKDKPYPFIPFILCGYCAVLLIEKL